MFWLVRACISQYLARICSDEFKREAVKLYRSADVSAKQVGAVLGVSESLLYRWSRELSDSRLLRGSRRTRNSRRRIGVCVESWIFKKGFELFRVSTIERYWFIDRWRERFSVVFPCARLGVTRSTYYAWCDRSRESKRARPDRRLLVMIRSLHQEWDGVKVPLAAAIQLQISALSAQNLELEMPHCDLLALTCRSALDILPDNASWT